MKHNFEPETRCNAQDCGRSDMHGRKYCIRHYKQSARHGKILSRTRHDPNEIACKNDICEMVLYKGKSELIEVARTIFNRNALENVKKYKWHLLNRKYVVSRSGGKNIFLHHLILFRKEGLDIDHINHNILDNRKCNLRYATRSQNLMNKKTNQKGTRVKGYYWDRRDKKWLANIVISGKYIYLGRFKEEKYAKQARQKAEKKYFKEFAFQDNS